MKKLMSMALLALSFSAFAETETAVAFIRAESPAALEEKIVEAVPLIQSGRYRPLHDNCSGNRKVYAVETSGRNYRVDRFGNLQVYYSAAIKYSCNR